MNNKKLTIALIIILSVFAFALTAGFIYFLIKGSNFYFNFNFKNTDMKLIGKYESESIDISKIYLNLLSTDTEIKESTDEKILIEYYSNQKKNGKIEHTDNIIKIDEENYNLSCFGICNAKRKVVLYLPATYVNEIEIKTKSGDIKSELVLNNFINISTMSGDVSLKEVKDIKVLTMSGDISFDKVSNKLTIDTLSGDILIHTLDIKEDSNITTTSGDVAIANNEINCYIEFNTVSGDQLIKKSDRKSDMVLSVKTISGDISVN